MFSRTEMRLKLLTPDDSKSLIMQKDLIDLVCLLSQQ